MQEHPPNLHRIADSTQPSGEPGSCTPAGTGLDDEPGEISGPEPDQRIVLFKKCDYDLPLTPVPERLPCHDITDLNECIVRDMETFSSLTFVTEVPCLCGSVPLPHGRQSLLQPRAQRGRQRLRSHKGSFDPQLDTFGLGLFQQRFEVARQPDERRRSNVGTRLHLQVHVTAYTHLRAHETVLDLV